MTRAESHRIPIDERLRAEPTVWLSSTRPDGRPHVVPVWFYWDGSAVDFYSKPQAQKVRNLRERPDVMLALGEADEEFDVELIEGLASVLADETARVIQPAMFEKYGALMARAGLDTETYIRTYSQPVRIRPTRMLGYGGKGWVDPNKATADGGDDVTGHLLANSLTTTQRAAVDEIRRLRNELRGASALDLLALDE